MKPLAPALRRLLATAAIEALGTGLFLPISVLALVHRVGLSEGTAALVLALAGVAAAISLPLTGSLIDRLGPRDVTIGCYLLAAGCLAAYAGATSAVPAGACLAGLAAAVGGAQAARGAFASALAVSGTGVRVLALVDGTRNLVFGLSGLLVATALALAGGAAYGPLILCNAATFALAAASCARLPVARPQRRERRLSLAIALRDRRFAALAALDAVMNMHFSLILVAMPLWVTTRTRAPGSLVGLLFSANAVLVVTLLLPASRRAGTVADARRLYGAAGPVLALACGAFASSGSVRATLAVPLVVAATILLTLGEILSRTGANGLALALAPPDARGRYLALYAVAFSAQRAYGPAVATAVVALGAAGWLGVAALLLAAALAAARMSRPFAGSIVNCD